MKIFRYIYLCCTLSLLLTACDSSRVYEDNKEIDGKAWDMNDKIGFDVDILDTNQVYNIYINVRQATHYPYRNLFLFVETTLPDKKTLRDTVELMLVDESGERLGSGLGDIWDNQIMWKEAVRFRQSGTYRFEYQHAMRTEKLPFIMDVGLRIEKAE